MGPFLALVVAFGCAAQAVAIDVKKCVVADGYTEAQLRKIAWRNIENVDRAKADIQVAEGGAGLSGAQIAVWRARLESAAAGCNVSRDLLRSPNQTIQGLRDAAATAADAWGAVMDGSECCTLLSPPYCIARNWNPAIIANIVPFLVLLLLFLGSILATLCSGSAQAAAQAAAQAEGVGPSESPMGPCGGCARRSLEPELRQAMQRSCLRALPAAESAAASSASLLSALCDAFDFQADSVRSQFEHLLSLWRSQCAMVADRAVGAEEPVDEAALLGTALGDLHLELLGGFQKWRAKLVACDAARVPARGPQELPSLAGAIWTPLAEDVRDSTPEGDSTAALSAKLSEIAAFLCIWGEAGNVRFMPELVYFITELALAASSGLDSSSRAEERSGLFLSKIVRPIYRVVFDEWYDEVDVDEGSGKDKPRLKAALKAFLPPNVGNYDDWNELFCDPKRLVASMKLNDKRPLFDLPHEERFAALERVDWEASLLAAATKTHREVHSLWGVFASTHRIWLLHSSLFFAAACAVAPRPPDMLAGEEPIFGRSAAVRYATVALVIPAHAVLWWIARWQVAGPAVRPSWKERGEGLKGRWVLAWFRELRDQPSWAARLRFLFCTPPDVVALFPAVTYLLLRCVDDGEDTPGVASSAFFLVHCVVSAFVYVHLLFVPSARYMAWELSHVRKRSRIVRYGFWLCVLAAKFLLGLIIIDTVQSTIEDLQIARLGQFSLQEIRQLSTSTLWWSNILVWCVLWGTTFVLFTADTQIWFTLGCTLLGVLTVFKQRGWTAASVIYEDNMGRLPERFSNKVLYYSPMPQAKRSANCSSNFPFIWDRIVAYMRYEDDIDSKAMASLSFDLKRARDGVEFRDLQRPLHFCATDEGDAAGASDSVRVRVPNGFRGRNASETCVKTYCCMPDLHEPTNADVRWRLAALGRGLGLPMPRPYRGPYFPGLTVLIPHYSEQILMTSKELFAKDERRVVPLVHWLKQKYEEEFLAFATRLRARNIEWPLVGDEWAEYSEEQRERLVGWASMRMQTLWRTVAGMCYYHPALQCHFELQGDMTSVLAQEGVWNASECFTCMVSMQQYKYFKPLELGHTDYMLEKFPSCLKIAFIDSREKGRQASADNVHLSQRRRYFSCLIDKTCKHGDDGRRLPLFSVELPGFPILGDGKGDNQNHAIPFMRGHFSQCIDANQGAYFEQMMLLPCALGEFRSHKRGDGLSKRIIGFPEHITSDIGSIGDFAASAEVAFGTILQRSYAVLGARMHYGHPDIMNKLQMMQQGGVSKATKTINLSEDIFAGMDFTLRGDGRRIHHREYFFLAKGRDMGFNAVLGFFSKLSSGTGEQLLSRQTFRLGQVLHLPDALSFYYAHAGFYLTQFFVSMSMPLLMFSWLLVLLSDCEGNMDVFQHCAAGKDPAAEAMARMLSACFSWLMLFFLVASTAPLFAELWMEFNFKSAMTKFLQSVLTLSPLMFVFQAKTIGYYIVNEFRYGGASYVATGRGLPTERRPLITKNANGAYEGLYLDYATIAHYDGMLLLVGLVLVYRIEQADTPNPWMVISALLTICSWLYAPYVFNPYNFSRVHFLGDMRSLLEFFFSESGRHWDRWYEDTSIKTRRGVRQSVNDIGFFVTVLFMATWYATLNTKATALRRIFPDEEKYRLSHAAILLPPIFGSLLWCLVVVLVESLLRCRSVSQRSLETDGSEGESAAPRGPRFASLQEGLPLAVSALVVGAVAVGESVAALLFFLQVGWSRAFIAGLILKWGSSSICIFLIESMLISDRCALAFTLPLRLWVRAHRMARDMVVSSVVALPQLPLVWLNALNDYICPGCSAHHLLIYRDPGTVEREERVLDLEDPRRMRIAAPEAEAMEDGATAAEPSAAGTLLQRPSVASMKAPPRLPSKPGASVSQPSGSVSPGAAPPGSAPPSGSAQLPGAASPRGGSPPQPSGSAPPGAAPPGGSATPPQPGGSASPGAAPPGSAPPSGSAPLPCTPCAASPRGGSSSRGSALPRGGSAAEPSSTFGLSSFLPAALFRSAPATRAD